MTTRKRLLTALLALLGSLAVAELACGLLLVSAGTFRGRPLPPLGRYLSAEQRQVVQRRRAELAQPSAERSSPFDPELGWVNPPTPSTAGTYNGFNSIGARGRREYPPSPPGGTLRLVGFGDSFMECAEVGWEATWQAQLEALEPRWEAINLGVSGYGTDQALLRHRRTGRGLGAHVVCIGLMLENVGRNVNRYRPMLHPATAQPLVKPRFVVRDGTLELVRQPFRSESELLDAIESGRVAGMLREHEHWADPDLPAWLWRSTLVRIAAAWWGSGRRDPRRMWLDADGEPRAVTLALLEAFHREALADGALAAPVLLWPQQLDLRGLVERDDRYWTGLLAQLDARGIPWLDLSQPLAEAARAAGTTAPLFKGWHLSEEGNAVVARAVRGWVRSEGIEAELER